MLLSVDHVTKRFPHADEPILDEVSFSIGAGEKVGIIGRSGAGKTTLARIVANLEPASSGSVTFKGKTVAYGKSGGRAGGERDAHGRGGNEHGGNGHSEHGGSSSRAHLVARGSREARLAWLPLQMIFQNPEASFSASMDVGRAVWEGAAYHPDLAKTPKKQRQQMVVSALEAVGLSAASAKKRPFELSGGQCQRAAIARALIGRPELVICDEATSSLDLTVQARIMDLLESLHEDQGMAFLFISHNLALVRQFCERIFVLEKGWLTEL